MSRFLGSDALFDFSFLHGVSFLLARRATLAVRLAALPDIDDPHCIGANFENDPNAANAYSVTGSAL